MSKILQRIAAGMGLLWVFSTLTWGDMTLVRSLKSGPSSGQESIDIKETLQIKGARAREDIHSRGQKELANSFDPLGEGVVLLLLDTDKIERLDMANQVYEETPMPQYIERLEISRQRQTHQTPDVRRIEQAQIKISPTTEIKKILGYACRKMWYEITLDIGYPDPKIRSKVRMVVMLWLTEHAKPLEQAQQELSIFQQSLAKKMGILLAPDDLRTFGVSQVSQWTGIREPDLSATLQKEFGELQNVKGFPVLLQVDWYLTFFREGKKVQMDDRFPLGKPFLSIRQTLDSISMKPLQAARFKHPADFNMLPDYSQNEKVD